jgi:hypothetical protein
MLATLDATRRTVRAEVLYEELWSTGRMSRNAATSRRTSGRSRDLAPPVEVRLALRLRRRGFGHVRLLRIPCTGRQGMREAESKHTDVHHEWGHPPARARRHLLSPSFSLTVSGLLMR